MRDEIHHLLARMQIVVGHLNRREYTELTANRARRDARPQAIAGIDQYGGDIPIHCPDDLLLELCKSGIAGLLRRIFVELFQ
jgi:hypothetical protein